MKLEKVKIELLKPAGYNPRKELKPEDKEYQKIKNSIEEFGYVEPIIVNKDFTIVGGHQRLNVLKDLGYKEADVIVIDIDKNKEKALNVALNKITGEWDFGKLGDLLLELDSENYDLELTGFDLDEIENIMAPVDDEVEEEVNERVRTDEKYNLGLFEPKLASKKYDMPIIKRTDFIPTKLISFNYMMTSQDKKCGIHCFIDDYQFERLWTSPSDYIEKLSEYECFLSPDFSLYLDMALPIQIYNVYRSRLLGQYYQRMGIKVIPTISWSDERSFDFCFEGVEKNSVVAVSTIGVKNDDLCYNIWVGGMNEMIKRLQPKTIIVYGGQVDYDYKGINVIYFDNNNTKDMRRRIKNEED